MSRAAVCLEPTNPDQHEYTMKITMTLADWKRLRQQLNANPGVSYTWPASQLREQIAQAIDRANQAFFPVRDESE